MWATNFVYRPFMCSYRTFLIFVCVCVCAVTNIFRKLLATVLWVVICAGKWWGSSNEQPIVALHGLFDNAGSYDFLCPHLDVPAVLALDLPGHGRSSHYAKGTIWSYTTMLMSLRYLLKNHFKWPKVYLMGHSYGSTLALCYAGLYPKQVDALITIDCARAANATEFDDLPQTVRRNVERSLAVENKSAVKPRSFEESINTMMTARKFALTKEQTVALAQRSLSNIGCGNYIFNEDLRMSVPSLGRNTHHGFEVIAGNVRCNVLNVVATDGILVGDAMTVVKKHCDIMKKNCPSVATKVISGGHHIQMDNPVEVAAAINGFWSAIELSSSTSNNVVPSASS